jgi:hypothetical protein
MFSKRKYLFKCNECDVVISLELTDSEINKYLEDSLKLECICGELLIPLHN